MGLDALILAPQPFYQNRGTPIAIKLLCESLEDTNINIDLLCLLEGEDIPLPKNVKVLRTNYPKFFLNLKPGFSWKKIFINLYLINSAAELINTNKYDVIIAVEEAAIFANFFLGKNVPLVVDMDSDIVEQLLQRFKFLLPFKRLLYSIYGSSFSNSLCTIAVSRELSFKAVQLGALQCYLLEDCGFDVKDNPCTETDSTHYFEGKKVILYTGNLERYQGIDLLLEGFKILIQKGFSDICLVIIGGTPNSISYYRKKSKQLKIDHAVFFLGQKKPEDLPPFFSLADVLVSPRLFGSNTPMKIYTYMAAGKPIVATAIKSHTQVLDEDSAYLVNLDPNSISQGLMDALLKGEESEKKGQNARLRFLSNYSREQFTQRVRTIFNEITLMIKGRND